MTAHFVDLLDQLQRRSLRMARLVQDILEEACDALLRGDEALAKRVILRDRDVDEEEVEVEAEVIRLMALYQPVGSDLRLLCTVLKVNNDLERIADCAVNIAERAVHLDPAAVAGQMGDLKKLGELVQELLRTAIQAYTAEDQDAARSVRLQDDAVDATYVDLIRDSIAALSQQPDSIAGQLDVLSVAKNLERIADHATNIAEDVIYLLTGKIVRHQAPGEPH